MAADSNIFQQYLKAPKSVIEYQADYDQADARKNALQMAAMDLSEKTQANQRAQQVRNALMGLGGTATDEQRIAAMRGTATPEGFTQADSLEKSILERQKTGAQVKKDNSTAAENEFSLRIKKSDQAIKDISGFATAQDAIASLQHHIQAGDVDPQQGAMILGQLQAAQTPQDFQKWQLDMVKNILSAKERMQYTMPDANTVANNQTSIANNTATNATTQRGQNITASTAAAGRAQADRHFQAGQNTPQYMETDSGLVALPKKLAPGQVPVGMPVAGADGQPLGKPLKAIPPAVNTAIIANKQSRDQITRALTLLGGNNIGDPGSGGMQGDKDATGWKGYLPNGILNRLDSKGVATRAEISDIGSLKIHDRSGAAVTVSESPRLMPFIPLATDDAATAQKKLTRLALELDNESAALASTYSKDQGYKPSPVKAAGTTPARSSDIHSQAEAILRGGK